MKNYFVDKYGAITDVDFSEVFENYMNNKEKDTLAYSFMSMLGIFFRKIAKTTITFLC